MKGLKYATALMVLLLVACANKDASLAFDAADADLGTDEVLVHAEKAYDDLDGLGMDDACKLTLAYFYLYSHTLNNDYGAKFRQCYERTQQFDHVEVATCLNELTGENKTAKLLRYAYKGSNIVESVSDISGDALEDIIDNL